MHIAEEWLAMLRVYMADFSWGIALFVFVAYIILDVLYAQYTMAVNSLQPTRAATTGSLMYFLLAIGVLNYAHNPLYIPGLVLGSWIGTYVAVEHKRRKKQKEE
jgi:uncharacterized membrane protein YfcA